MKKFILTVTFILVAIIQNIVSAADLNSVDWNNAPRFGNKQDFINYIKNCEYNCKASVPVVFTNGLFVNVEEFVKFAQNCQYVNITWWKDNNGQPTKTLYELTFYPGTKVAYAYRTGDTSILSGEEWQLYNIAVGIVNEANQQPTTLLKELYLHDAITKRVKYYTRQTNEKAPRHCNAIGALIDGRANCQGYSDAFYMLGTMGGFNVGKMSGISNNGKGNEPHVWNTINLGGGNIYAVDVTWDDATFTTSEGEYNHYIYFNAPLEIMQTTHTWEAAYNPTICSNVDGAYFYYTQEFWDTEGEYFGFHADTAEDALVYIGQRIAQEGFNVSLGMAPYDARYANLNFSLNHLVKEILPQRFNWYGYVNMSVAHRGNWLFFTVSAKKNN